jgi:hypothetical protein
MIKLLKFSAPCKQPESSQVNNVAEGKKPIGGTLDAFNVPRLKKPGLVPVLEFLRRDSAQLANLLGGEKTNPHG